MSTIGSVLLVFFRIMAEPVTIHFVLKKFFDTTTIKKTKQLSSISFQKIKIISQQMLTNGVIASSSIFLCNQQH